MEIVNFLKSFAAQNGAVDVVVLVLTVILTNLIKIPIKRHAEKMSALANKAGFGLSKSFFTSSIVYIPFAVSFGLFCAAGGIQYAVSGTSFSLVAIMAKTSVIAAASIGFYSLLSNTIEKAAKKEIYTDYKQDQIIKEAEKAERASADEPKATT